MNTIDYLVIGAQNKMAKVKESFRNFMSSERGVSNVVATIIILLIVVLLIGVFWDRLQAFLKGIMDTIFSSEFTADGL
ncbi:MAG: hypothetical protein IJZ34_07995 [Lachnospiraceae bacterium]|nr:hypothetical protein [Lachnospiraceae bacterium]